MIRASKPKRTRTHAHAQRTDPPEEPSSSLPKRCACGAEWSVSCPGDAGPPARDTIVLCFTCARERGWPNLRVMEKKMSEQLSSGTVPPVVPSVAIDGFDAAFEAFWKAYPKRSNNPKHAARLKLEAALKRVDLSVIMDGLARYEFSPDPKFRPMASTWLFQRRYEIEHEDLTVDGYGVEEWLKALPRDGRLSAHAYEPNELRAVMVSTGLPATWRGSLEILNRWMQDGYAPDSCAKVIAAAVVEFGSRTSLVPFDKRVRQRAIRTIGK